MQHNFHLSLLAEAVAMMCPSSKERREPQLSMELCQYHIEHVRWDIYCCSHVWKIQAAIPSVYPTVCLSSYSPIQPFLYPSTHFIFPSFRYLSFHMTVHPSIPLIYPIQSPDTFCYLISARYSPVLSIMSSSGRMRLIFIKNLLSISLFIFKITA